MTQKTTGHFYRANHAPLNYRACLGVNGIFTGRTTGQVRSCPVGIDFLNQAGDRTCSVVAQGRPTRLTILLLYPSHRLKLASVSHDIFQFFIYNKKKKKLKQFLLVEMQRKGIIVYKNPELAKTKHKDGDARTND